MWIEFTITNAGHDDDGQPATESQSEPQQSPVLVAESNRSTHEGGWEKEVG